MLHFCRSLDRLFFFLPEDIFYSCVYFNIVTWFRGFQVKIVIFFIFFCPSISKRDLDTKKAPLNIGVFPESLGAILDMISIYQTWNIKVLPRLKINSTFSLYFKTI